MKTSFRYLSFLSAVFVVLLVGCSSKAETTPEESAACALRTLATNSINGTSIEETVTLAGLVTDSKTGKPIVGLPVTDGYTFVTTDSHGVYKMTRNPLSRKVYYTTPSEYQIVLDESRHQPRFFSDGMMNAGNRYRVDFELTPLSAPEEELTFIMVGDPQCANSENVARYTDETIPDIKAAVSEAGLKNVYAVTLGDIIYDSNDMWSGMRASMSNVSVGGSYIPFFQTTGNHDHNALAFTDADDDETKCYKANEYFDNIFGPHDYSFDRGDVHVVVLDNVMPYDSKTTSKSNGKTCKYNSGLYDSQYEWLRQDLGNVANKADKILFVCMHIPIRGTTANHLGDVLNLCTGFKEAHVMTGHTHYSQNYIHSTKVCVGGNPVYEHVHGAACGAWWSCNSNVNGGPNGYTVYKVSGGKVQDWQMKGTGCEFDYQLRAYDGNQTYSGNKGYNYNWYNPSNVGGAAGIVAKGNDLTRGCFVVEFFDDDSANCTVEYWKDGQKVGDFKRLENGTCANIAICSYFFNELGKNTSTWATVTASHYWYYRPASGAPSSETGWEIRATRTIPTSGISHIYTINKLTTNYSEF